MALRLHQNKSLRDFRCGPVVKTTLPPQEAWVPSLVREPRSHMHQIKKIIIEMKGVLYKFLTILELQQLLGPTIKLLSLESNQKGI